MMSVAYEMPSKSRDRQRRKLRKKRSKGSHSKGNKAKALSPPAKPKVSGSPKACISLLKRPSGALASPSPSLVGAKRPPAPLGSAKNVPSVVYWGGGKVYTSWTKKSYRVMRAVGDRVDVCVRWESHGGHAGAWKRALDLIAEAR